MSVNALDADHHITTGALLKYQYNLRILQGLGSVYIIILIFWKTVLILKVFVLPFSMYAQQSYTICVQCKISFMK